MFWLELVRVVGVGVLLGLLMGWAVARRPFHLERLRPRYWRAVLGRMGPGNWAKLVAVALGVAVASILISENVSEMLARAEIQTISSPSEFPVTALQEAVGEEHPWIPLLMVNVLPIFEEWIFRGILIDELMRWRGSRLLAVAVSTAVFSIFHLSNPGTMPAYALLLVPGGALLGVCYLSTGLGGAILAHDLYNTYAYLAMIKVFA